MTLARGRARYVASRQVPKSAPALRMAEHTIRMDASGDEVKIKLDRKWNGKTPWEIEDY